MNWRAAFVQGRRDYFSLVPCGQKGLVFYETQRLS